MSGLALFFHKLQPRLLLEKRGEFAFVECHRKAFARRLVVLSVRKITKLEGAQAFCGCHPRCEGFLTLWVHDRVRSSVTPFDTASRGHWPVWCFPDQIQISLASCSALSPELVFLIQICSIALSIPFLAFSHARLSAFRQKSHGHRLFRKALSTEFLAWCDAGRAGGGFQIGGHAASVDVAPALPTAVLRCTAGLVWRERLFSRHPCGLPRRRLHDR